MLNKHWNFAVILLIAALALAGCSDDGSETGDAGNNLSEDGGADTGEADAGEEDAGEEDAGEQDAGEEDAGDEDVAPAERPLVPEFSYEAASESCGTSSCIDGVSINIGGSGTITKVENGSGLTRSLADADLDALDAQVSTEEVHARMSDGFACGDATDFDGAKWTFNGRVLDDDGATYLEVTQNVSGCVGSESTEDDAQLVQDIITLLDELRADHFD